MTDRQLAALWWRQLFSELGTSAHTGSGGPLGQLANDRHRAVTDLFFTLLLELPTDCLIEVGAHDAEASKRFVGAKQNARAFAYEAAPETFERVVGQGLPERLRMYNCAIGAQSGPVKFFVPRERRLAVWASTRKRAGNVDVQELMVPMVSLDEAGRSIVPTSHNRDLGIWIDVEGSALDVLSSGECLLKHRVAIAYIEVNDISAYDGAATSLDVISLLLKHGFIPVARDNQFGDAWNLLAVHEDACDLARESIAKWFYQFSGFAASTSWLVSKEVSIEQSLLASALRFQAIYDAASGSALSFNEDGRPALLPTPDLPRRSVLISCHKDARGALVSLPDMKVCRADRTGTLVTDRSHVMAHEIFELLPISGSEFRMRSHWGAFVRLRPDNTFDATADSATKAARFTVRDLDSSSAEIEKLSSLHMLGNLASYNQALGSRMIDHEIADSAERNDESFTAPVPPTASGGETRGGIHLPNQLVGSRELVNHGTIRLNQESVRPTGAFDRECRTIIVSGLSRSGTSMVAGLLKTASIHIGTAIDNVVYEDTEIAKLSDTGDMAGLRALIVARNAERRVWGFKKPQLHQWLKPEDIALFRNPKLIFTFRDPIAIAQRYVISEYLDQMVSFRMAIAATTELGKFIEQLRCPILLISYEKALSYPKRLVDELALFCGLNLTEAQRELMISGVSGSPVNYLTNAIRHYRGSVDGISDGKLRGWCQEVHSDAPVRVTVRADGKPIANPLADQFRPDLRDAGVGKGRHAFSVDLSGIALAESLVIQVVVAGLTFALANSGLTVAALKKKASPRLAGAEIASSTSQEMSDPRPA
jgi:FkbM family methyltransferase